jgi:zinc/manganese transport system substrate-binding protein
MKAIHAGAVKPAAISAAILAVAVLFAGCQKAPGASGSGKKTIVVTYSMLGSVVKDLVGDAFTVFVEIPNGLDPHEWEPSAKDIETLTRADLVVENGLGLEGGMEKALAQARSSGVRFFTASDHVQVERVGAGEGVPAGGSDQAAGAKDPHLWMDPVGMSAVAMGLSREIRADFGVNLSARAADLEGRLTALDAEIRAAIQRLSPESRKLVTGHESLGYFARRYRFTLVGAVIPSLSSQAEASASQMAALAKLIRANGVKVVFTELGTPPAVVDALAKQAGARAVPLATHSLPEGGDYFAYMRNLTDTIVSALK